MRARSERADGYDTPRPDALLSIKTHSVFFRKSEMHPILRESVTHGMFAAISENHSA